MDASNLVSLVAFLIGTASSSLDLFDGFKTEAVIGSVVAEITEKLSVSLRGDVEKRLRNCMGSACRATLGKTCPSHFFGKPAREDLEKASLGDAEACRGVMRALAKNPNLPITDGEVNAFREAVLEKAAADEILNTYVLSLSMQVIQATLADVNLIAVDTNERIRVIQNSIEITARERLTPIEVFPAVRENDNPFHGRHAELEAVMKRLHDKRRVIIVGMGGAGKTALAREVACQWQKQNYGCCYELRANGATLREALCTFHSDGYGIPGMTQEEVNGADGYRKVLATLRAFFHEEPNALLVIDDLSCDETQEGWDTALASLPCCVLVTTRGIRFGESLQVSLSNYLDETSCLHVFSDALGRNLQDNEIPSAKEIAHLALYYPLALKLLGAYCRNTSDDLLELISKFKTAGPFALEGGPSVKGNEPYAAVMDFVFNHADAAVIAEVPLLKRLCCLDMNGVHKADLKRWLQCSDDVLNRLRDRSWLQVDRLTGKWSIHDAISATLERNLRPTGEDLDGLLKPILDDLQNASTYAQALSPLTQMSCLCLKFPAETRSIASYALRKSYQLGMISIALAIQKSVLAYDELTQEPSSLTLAASYDTMGVLLQATGDLKAARVHFKRALDIREAVLNPLHLDIAVSFNNLGLLCRAEADFAQARQYLESSLAIQEAIFGPLSQELATAYNNLGLLLRDCGEYQAALAYLEKNLAICEATLDGQSSQLATSYSNMATVLQLTGSFEEALLYLKKALMIQEAVLDPQSPDLAKSYGNFGTIYFNQGNLEAAQSYLEKALRIREAILNPFSPTLAKNYSNLASVLHAKGQSKEAQNYYQRALDILKANDIDAFSRDIAIITENISKLPHVKVD